MRKTCFKCLEEKDIDQFYRHRQMADGHLNKCKACAKSDVSAHRSENIEKVREYDRRRGDLPHRVEARLKYSKTERGLRAGNKAKKRWTSRNPHKKAASTLVMSAIKKGRIKRGPCEVCGSVIRIHGHHDDYTKPMEVRWLCPKHHRKHHKGGT